MSKQSQASETKSNERSRPRVKPAVVEELTNDLASLAQLLGGPIAAVGDGTIQAQAALLGDPRLRTVQRQALAAQTGRIQGNRHLQRVTAAIKVTQDPGSIASTGTRGSGSTIPFKSEMERAFGQDFSHVRAHTDAEAHRASKALGTKAYTVGNDIAFGTSTPDRGTVAHELTHIVQHETSHGAQASGVTSKSAPAEHEARDVQQAIVSGQKLPAISETLASSSIAGDWWIDNEGHAWRAHYSPVGESVTATWLGRLEETLTGGVHYNREFTPERLTVRALERESGLEEGGLSLHPQQPDIPNVLYCCVNNVEELDPELRRLNSLNAFVAEPTVEPTAEPTEEPREAQVETTATRPAPVPAPGQSGQVQTARAPYSVSETPLPAIPAGPVIIEPTFKLGGNMDASSTGPTSNTEFRANLQALRPEIQQTFQDDFRQMGIEYTAEGAALSLRDRRINMEMQVKSGGVVEFKADGIKIAHTFGNIRVQATLDVTLSLRFTGNAALVEAILLYATIAASLAAFIALVAEIGAGIAAAIEAFFIGLAAIGSRIVIPINLVPGEMYQEAIEGRGPEQIT